MKIIVLALAVLAAFAPGQAWADNYPCSKSKGGVERCEGTKFVCRDGSVSASKKKCTPESAERFRRMWDRDNGGQLQEGTGEEQQGFKSRGLPLTCLSGAAADICPAAVDDIEEIS